MGDNSEGLKLEKRVFVTVGTTCFDALVRAVDNKLVKEELQRKGYSHVLIQMRRGSYVPTKPEGDGSLAIDYFTFYPSITVHLRSASLVISHAGSGSIFETLRLVKRLLLVVNEDLMDNHQSELSEELAAERKHLYYARLQTLHWTIVVMNSEGLIPYIPGDAEPVAKLINRFLCFADRGGSTLGLAVAPANFFIKN